MKTRRLIACALFCLCFAGTLHAKQDTYVVEGCVGESSTVPAAGESVKLIDGDSGKVVDTDQTNFFGKYKFKEVAPGYYILQAGKIRKELMVKKKKVRLDIDLSDPSGSMDYSKSAQAAASEARPAATGPNDQALMQRMAAHYYDYQGSTESRMALCPNGAYYDRSESSYSGKSHDSLGNETMAWGNASQSAANGTWTIQGSDQRGTITVARKDGNVTRMQYQAIDNQGCFNFNGATLCREGPANCQ